MHLIFHHWYQNQEYVKDFINGFLERYGKVVDIIEFWNEPGGQSAFWYDHDNDHVLIEMLKTTHECVEAYNEKNGTDVKYVDTFEWIPRDPLHPLRDGHQTVAKNLVPLIKEFI